MKEKLLVGLMVLVTTSYLLGLTVIVMPVVSAGAKAGEEGWREGWNVSKEDLEGPDYLQPPKHYKTLGMMLADSGVKDYQGPPPVPVAGTRELLVILVQLSDVTPDASHTVAYFQDRFFDTAPPSARDYFLEVSYGAFTYIPGAVLGWYNSTYDQNQWANVDKRPVVVEAIQDADPFFNFAPYDTDTSGTVTNDELTIFIIVSGNQGGASHWWTIGSVATADGVNVEGEFSNTHEYRHIGSYVHELGHDLGLPDLYDTDDTITGDSEGIGNYGLMGGGSWTFSHMTAWSKIQLGWITPTIVTANGYFDVNDAETNAEAYVLVDTTYSTDEYFLVENRHPTNSYYETVSPPVAPSGTYPDSGIVIYHIDETKMQDWINSGINNVNVDETHKGVDVESADSPSSHFIDADDLDAENNRGDANDLWDINEYDFYDGSVPCNANWYPNIASGMDVRDLPAAAATMRVYLSIEEVEHDVEAYHQHPTAPTAVQGDIVQVVVNVRNNGNIQETFDVYAWAESATNSYPIGTQPVTNLAAGATQGLIFDWDTTGVVGDTYNIYAMADSARVIAETDEVNNNCTSEATIRIMVPPVADPDGPYEVDEGFFITLDGSGSYDPDGVIVSWDWDIDNDGQYDDASGEQVPWVWGRAGDYTIGLNVTDNDGLWDTESTTVAVNNLPPDVDAGDDQESLPGHQFTEFCFTGYFKDPSWLDLHTAEWDFGDGSPPEPGVVAYEPWSFPNPIEGSVDEASPICHRYWVPYQDNYMVTLTVTDDLGGVGTDTLTVTILRVIGGEELPLDVGTILSSMLYSYWWVPTLMTIALAVVYIKRRRR